MQKTYTIAEACKALKVSPRTLHGWMKKAAVQSEQSPIDYREHVLTAHTVKHLATLHGVTIVDDSQEPSPPASRAVKQLKAEVAALESRVNELQSQLDTLYSEFREFMDDVSSRLAAPVERLQQPKILKPSKPEYQISGTTGQGLPEGYVSVSSFRHKVPETTVNKAIKSGRLHAIPGLWKNGQATIRYALDAAGQQQFLTLYRANPNFKKCEDPECPCHA